MSVSTTEEHQRARRALVTGASSGIGAAITQRLLDAGWHVLGMSRTAPEIRHAHLEHLPVDISDRDALAQALGTVGSVDAIVHAAGILRVGTLGNLDPANGAAMWRLHVDAAEQMVEALVPAMPDGGRIVLIGSRTATGSLGRAQYAATKSTLR